MKSNMKSKVLLALTLLVAATTDGFASLWDTFDQCVAKYGKPIHVSDDITSMSGGPGAQPIYVKRGDLLSSRPSIAHNCGSSWLPQK